MSDITVTGLVTYPVKSCAGIALREARVTPRGLELDRDFMLVGDDRSFISQRQVPELALIVPSVGESSISLTAPGMERVEIPLEQEPDDRRLVAATVHGKPVTGQLVSEELSEWFTTFLPRYKDNTRFRLLRVREDQPRPINQLYRQPDASNHFGFADGSAMLLASERSLSKLNGELEQPVPMNRFRPNIVVDGPALKPYDEDHWERISVGALGAYVVKACDRCVIPDVDQDSAVTGKAVRRALRTRKGANAHDPSNKGVFFAQNLNHVYAPGVTVKLGDTVRVLSRAAAPNVLIG